MGSNRPYSEEEKEIISETESPPVEYRRRFFYFGFIRRRELEKDRLIRNEKGKLSDNYMVLIKNICQFDNYSYLFYLQIQNYLVL